MPATAFPAGADPVVAGTLAPLTLARPLFTALAVARLLATLLGLVVAVQAFRGYRRNESRPMLYLAVGFALIGVRPLVTIPVARLVPPSELAELSLALDVVLLGTAFAAVLYSMHLIDGPRDDRPSVTAAEFDADDERPPEDRRPGDGGDADE